MSSQQIDLSLFIPFVPLHPVLEVFAGLAGAGEYSLPIDRSCVFDDNRDRRFLIRGCLQNTGGGDRCE